MTGELFKITFFSFYINTWRFKNKKYHIWSDRSVLPPRILPCDSHDAPFHSVILHSFYNFIRKVSKVNSISTPLSCKFLMDKHLCLFLSPTAPSRIPWRKHISRCFLMVRMLCFLSQGLHLSANTHPFK